MNGYSHICEPIAHEESLIRNALMNPTHIRYTDKLIRLLGPDDISFVDVANVFHMTASKSSV